MFDFRNMMSFVLAAVLLTGCVNTPTQTSNIKDDRPLIMFDATQSGDLLILDGIEIGQANQYRTGRSALKIEPGTHNLQIIRSGEIIMTERFYISRGASKTFTVQEYR